MENAIMANEDNFVIVGQKSTMNYVVACVTLFNTGINVIKVKARGRSISTAIETVEMLRKAFIKGLKINNIDIGSQTFEKMGKTRTISTIEITLTKPKIQ
jgi:DNA-binding protein